MSRRVVKVCMIISTAGVWYLSAVVAGGAIPIEGIAWAGRKPAGDAEITRVDDHR